jgi:hypothetical protein
MLLDSKEYIEQFMNTPGGPQLECVLIYDQNNPDQVNNVAFLMPDLFVTFDITLDTLEKVLGEKLHLRGNTWRRDYEDCFNRVLLDEHCFIVAGDKLREALANGTPLNDLGTGNATAVAEQLIEQCDHYAQLINGLVTSRIDDAYNCEDWHDISCARRLSLEEALDVVNRELADIEAHA